MTLPPRRDMEKSLRESVEAHHPGASSSRETGSPEYRGRTVRKDLSRPMKRAVERVTRRARHSLNIRTPNDHTMGSTQSTPGQEIVNRDPSALKDFPRSIHRLDVHPGHADLSSASAMPSVQPHTYGCNVGTNCGNGNEETHAHGTLSISPPSYVSNNDGLNDLEDSYRVDQSSSCILELDPVGLASDEEDSGSQDGSSTEATTSQSEEAESRFH